jgi:hypothetical protein
VVEDAEDGHPPSTGKEQHHRVDDSGDCPDHASRALPEPEAIGTDGLAVDAGHGVHDRLEAAGFRAYSLLLIISLRDYLTE